MQESQRASKVNVDAKAIAALCQHYHIRALSLFGSVLRDDFNATSDVDLLVDFEAGYVPGFLRLHAIEQELSALFGGRRIDLVTTRSLSPRLRNQVLTSAEVLFAA
jgi:uncharacterized protein